MTLADALGLIGANTPDIFLNETTFWSNVPMRAWEYSIAGYQVLKKWLTYREARLLGRPLTPQEAGEFMNIARRLAALLLLEPKLDDNYRAATNPVFAWTSKASAARSP